MTTLQQPPAVTKMPPISPPTPREGGSTPHRFTAAEYEEMSRRGLLVARRTELIDGELLDMAAQELPHMRAITRCFFSIRKAYDDPANFWVVCQGTLRLGERDMPEPDVYVLPCGETTPKEQLPLPLFVLEVADSSYRYDTERKPEIYARHGVAEYLVLDVNRRQLEVHRDPKQNAGHWMYGTRTVLGESDTFRPLAGPPHEFKVAEMLP